MALVCYFHGSVRVIDILNSLVYSPLPLPHGKFIRSPCWDLRWSFSYCTWIFLGSQCFALQIIGHALGTAVVQYRLLGVVDPGMWKRTTFFCLHRSKKMCDTVSEAELEQTELVSQN